MRDSLVLGALIFIVLFIVIVFLLPEIGAWIIYGLSNNVGG